MSLKEINAAVVLLTIVIVHCLVYVPTMIIWITWDFGAVLGILVYLNSTNVGLQYY